MPQALYLMNLLSGVLQLYCDLASGVQLESEEPVHLRIVLPEAEK